MIEGLSALDRTRYINGTLSDEAARYAAKGGVTGADLGKLRLEGLVDVATEGPDAEDERVRERYLDLGRDIADEQALMYHEALSRARSAGSLGVAQEVAVVVAEQADLQMAHA